MGFLDALTMRNRQAEITAALATSVQDPSTFPIASPWSTSTNLERIVAEDIFGSDLPTNSRAAAMRIPAIARGRNLMCSTIARLPLRAARVAADVPVQPPWMSASLDGSTPQHKINWTVDDLIFSGWSCWWRENNADGSIRATCRINQGEWAINGEGRVEVRGTEAPDANVILIPGFHEGILSFGRDTIADARSLYDIVRARLRNPVAQVDLHQTAGAAMTEDDIDAMIERWSLARRGINGGVGYSSQHIEVRELGATDAPLMIEARNAASLDLARLIGISANRIDATSAKASLNYETTTGRNQEFVDFDLALYMTPITARLSLDDVLPHGTRAYFDLADFIAAAPSVAGPALED